jgi:MoxR-like ATPase
MRYLWDRDEQIGPLSALIQGILRQQPVAQAIEAHALAATPEQVDAEAVAKLLDDADKQLRDSSPTMANLARLREQVSRLGDQAAWIGDEKKRRHLLDRATSILEKIGP